MAKIVATFDTVDKTLEVTQDGETLDNVTSVSFSQSMGYMSDNGDMCCYITMMDKDEENDMKTSHTLMASADQNKAKGDILDYMKNFVK